MTRGSGDKAKARELYAKLQAMCVKSDGMRPGLAALNEAYSARE